MFALLKLILNFFSRAPKLSLIPKVSPSPNIKKEHSQCHSDTHLFHEMLFHSYYTLAHFLPNFYPERFMLCKQPVYNSLSL